MIFEHLSIYNFNLSVEKEAYILSQFSDHKHDLLFPYFECNFSVFPEDRAYIEKRVVIKSSDNILGITNPRLINEVVYWYRPKDIEDLIHIIIKDRITYHCIVVPKDEDVAKYRFKLFTYEHAMYQEEETRVLWIEEAEVNDYLTNIQPKILSYVNSK